MSGPTTRSRRRSPAAPIIGSTTGTASTIVNLVEPNSLFLDYQNRLDLRVGKTFRFDRTRIQGFVDVFNVFNAGTVMSVNQTYGAVAPPTPG